MTTKDLQRVQIFQGLSEEEIQKLVEISYPRNIEKDGFYFHQGDPARNVFVLTKGRVKITQVTRDGQNVILRMFSSWEVFGAIAILPDKDYPVSAQAAENCRALAWKGEELYKFSERHPELLSSAMEIMSDNFQALQDRYRQLATERVERRLARSLLRLGLQIGQKDEEGVRINLSITRQDLADMSGTTIFTASRILSRWEQSDLIISGRQHIIICDQHGLVKIAENISP